VPESERESALLLRFYLSFVHGLVHNGLTGVLLAPQNISGLDQFLTVLVEVRAPPLATAACAISGSRRLPHRRLLS
jgi:hypothetical protein